MSFEGKYPPSGTGGGGGGSGTVTSVSVTPANGVSGTVANATTTPAISLTLGAITPSSVAATGTVTGSNLSGTNTGDQTNITGNAGTVTTISGQIAAGTNVSLSGSGTTASPYTISSSNPGGTVTSVAVSGGTTGLTTSGGPVTGSGTITLGGTLAVANGGTGVTSSTGTGNVVLSNSPTLVSPALGTPASGVATNLTGLPLTTGVTGTLGVANGGTGATTSTGTGAVVLANTPTIATPVFAGNPTDSSGRNYARGLTPTYQSSSTFTAVVYTSNLVNTTAGAITAFLPTGAAGNVISFVDDAGTWATNNLTITPNAQNIQGIASAGSLICNLSGAWVELAWDSTNSYWVVAASGFQYGPTYSPGVSGGIVPSSGLPGAGTGTAIATGTIGQYVEGIGTAVSVAAGVTTTIASVTLTPGVWEISGWLYFAAVTSLNNIAFGIATATNSQTGWDTLRSAGYLANVNASNCSAGIPGYRLLVTTTTSYYLTASAGAQAPNANGSLRAWLRG